MNINKLISSYEPLNSEEKIREILDYHRRKTIYINHNAELALRLAIKRVKLQLFFNDELKKTNDQIKIELEKSEGLAGSDKSKGTQKSETANNDIIDFSKKISKLKNEQKRRFKEAKSKNSTQSKHKAKRGSVKEGGFWGGYEESIKADERHEKYLTANGPFYSSSERTWNEIVFISKRSIPTGGQKKRY